MTARAMYTMGSPIANSTIVSRTSAVRGDQEMPSLQLRSLTASRLAGVGLQFLFDGHKNPLK